MREKAGDNSSRVKFHEDKRPVLRNNLRTQRKRQISFSGVKPESEHRRMYTPREMAPKNLTARIKEASTRLGPPDKKSFMNQRFFFDKPQRTRLKHRKPKENNFSVNSKFESSSGGTGPKRNDVKLRPAKMFKEKKFLKDFILKSSKLPKFPCSKSKKKRKK